MRDINIESSKRKYDTELHFGDETGPTDKGDEIANG